MDALKLIESQSMKSELPLKFTLKSKKATRKEFRFLKEPSLQRNMVE